MANIYFLVGGVDGILPEARAEEARGFFKEGHPVIRIEEENGTFLRIQGFCRKRSLWAAVVRRARDVKEGRPIAMIGRLLSSYYRSSPTNEPLLPCGESDVIDISKPIPLEDLLGKNGHIEGLPTA